MPRICKNCEADLKPYQKKYCSKACQADYRRYKSYPKLDREYFKAIDTKDKAYWLGFLFADGHIRSNGRCLSIVLCAKDDDQINKFCEAVQISPDHKKYYGPYGNTKRQVHLSVYDHVFVGHLVEKGCTPKKTLVLEFPDLEAEELKMAFLLGYHDGDGTEKSSLITCGSVQFLEVVRDEFSIQYEIKVEGENTFKVTLGTDLFMRLLDNYRDSMPRKRRTNASGLWYDEDMKKRSNNHCTDCRVPITLEATRCQKCSKEHPSSGLDTRKNKPELRKFDPSPEELKELVWEIPASKVGEHFGVSGRAIKKRCRKYGIETPGRGYWQKKRAGKV